MRCDAVKKLSPNAPVNNDELCHMKRHETCRKLRDFPSGDDLIRGSIRDPWQAYANAGEAEKAKDFYDSMLGRDIVMTVVNMD